MAVTPAAAAAPSTTAAPAAPSKKYLEIKSPTPGTFYRSSSPDAEPFAKVGMKVKADTVVCIIEAMKVFNEIPAECAGKIAAVMAQNGDAIEFNQPLFRVEPD